MKLIYAIKISIENCIVSLKNGRKDTQVKWCALSGTESHCLLGYGECGQFGVLVQYAEGNERLQS